MGELLTNDLKEDTKTEKGDSQNKEDNSKNISSGDEKYKNMQKEHDVIDQKEKEYADLLLLDENSGLSYEQCWKAISVLNGRVIASGKDQEELNRIVNAVRINAMKKADGKKDDNADKIASLCDDYKAQAKNIPATLEYLDLDKTKTEVLAFVNQFFADIQNPQSEIWKNLADTETLLGTKLSGEAKQAIIDRRMQYSKAISITYLLHEPRSGGYADATNKSISLNLGADAHHMETLKPHLKAVMTHELTHTLQGIDQEESTIDAACGNDKEISGRLHQILTEGGAEAFTNISGNKEGFATYQTNLVFLSYILDYLPQGKERKSLYFQYTTSGFLENSGPLEKKSLYVLASKIMEIMKTDPYLSRYLQHKRNNDEPSQQAVTMECYNLIKDKSPLLARAGKLHTSEQEKDFINGIHQTINGGAMTML